METVFVGPIRGQRGRWVESLSVREVRRLALVCSGLLKPELTGIQPRAAGKGARVRQRCHGIIGRFGYLQLDTVSVAGARSHAIVLASRLQGFDASVAETLLVPGEPLFEYWGHEASWIPLSLYPCFAFRRQAFRVHPWWGDLLGEHPKIAGEILRRVANDGPFRSKDLEGRSGQGWWDLKLTKRVTEALWSAGELAVRERRGFQRIFDLPERVIPDALRGQVVDESTAFDTLVLQALQGHGWATTSTIVATWRLASCRGDVDLALRRLVESGRIRPCTAHLNGRVVAGWVRERDLEMLADLQRLRPRPDRGVLLSPFDPLLWDRRRVAALFGFDLVIEIYKPAHERRHGYYCLPVLAGEELVARVDLKADRRRRSLRALSTHYETTEPCPKTSSAHEAAVASALSRYAASVGLELERG